MTAVAAVPTNDIKLQIRRTYAADPMTIFQAWTRPEVIKEWFGPPTRTIKSVTVDPRLGGAYRIEMESCLPDDPNPIVSVNGVYTAFEPGKLLVFTWEAPWSPGEKTQVTIALEPDGDSTSLLLTHELFQTEQSRDAHTRGWGYAFDKMATLFPNA